MILLPANIRITNQCHLLSEVFAKDSTNFWAVIKKVFDEKADLAWLSSTKSGDHGGVITAWDPIPVRIHRARLGT
jgi:hypothetical protein